MDAPSLNHLAFVMIHRRWRQYVTLSIGIFLAVFFAATMLLFGSGIPQTLRYFHEDRKGQQDAVLFDVGDAPLDELVQSGIVTQYGVTEILAEVEARAKTNFSAFSVARFDDRALFITGKRLITGRLPTKAGEIALEQEALSLQRITAKPGDRIQLTFRVPDGSAYLERVVTRDYLLTGILADQRLYLQQEVLEDQFAYSDYPAGILSQDEMIEAGGNAIRTAYIQTAEGVDSSDPRLRSFVEQHGIHFEWTGFSTGSVLASRQPGVADILYTLGIGVFLALILLLAACLGIVNAFSSALLQRKQQIGLLRAVGATKRQIRQVFGREVLLLIVFSIPAALALGTVMVSVLFRLLGPSFRFVVQPLMLVLVAAVSLVTISVAANVPLRQAGRIPPMQAIRDADLSRKMKRRRIRSQNVFDVPHLLASRSMKLYRNRMAGITLLLILSLLLVMVVPFLLEGELRRSLAFGRSDYEISRSSPALELIQYGEKSGLNDRDITEIAALPGISTVSVQKRLPLNLLVDEAADYFTLGGYTMNYDYLMASSDHDMIHRRPGAFERYQTIKGLYQYTGDLLTSALVAVDAATLERLTPFVYEGQIRIDKIQSGEEIVLIAPPAMQVTVQQNGGSGSIGILPLKDLTGLSKQNSNTTNKKVFIFVNDQLKAGDEITLSLLQSNSPPVRDANEENIPATDAIRIDKTVRIGALARPSDDSSVSGISPLTSLAGMAAMGFEAPYSHVGIHLTNKPEPDLEAYLTDQLDMIARRTDGYRMTAWLSLAEKNRWLFRILMLGTMSVALLFFAIVISLVNQSLTARIRSGRREIGTLRAVGASLRDIMRSYDLQMAYQFGLGFIIGIPVGWAFCYWFAQTPNVPWPSLPVWQPLLCLALLVLITRTNVWFKLRQVHKESITDNIREL